MTDQTCLQVIYRTPSMWVVRALNNTLSWKLLSSAARFAVTSFDDSADETNLPVTATLRGNIIVTSHLRSIIDDSKLLLDIKKLYGSDFFDDAVHLFERRISAGTPWHLPCNQLYLLRGARELQSML